jgi:hypothetical protein
VIANKWDLVKDGEWTQEDWERRLRWKLRSSRRGSDQFHPRRSTARIAELLRAVRAGAPTAAARRNRRAEPGDPPRGGASRRLRRRRTPYQAAVRDAAEVDPPTFVFFLNDASLVHFGYRRYAENIIRGAFGFEGTAIKLVFRGRSDEHAPDEASSTKLALCELRSVRPALRARRLRYSSLSDHILKRDANMWWAIVISALLGAHSVPLQFRGSS